MDEAINRVPWRKDSALGDGGDVGLNLTGGWYDGKYTVVSSIVATGLYCLLKVDSCTSHAHSVQNNIFFFCEGLKYFYFLNLLLLKNKTPGFPENGRFSNVYFLYLKQCVRIHVLKITLLPVHKCMTLFPTCHIFSSPKLSWRSRHNSAMRKDDTRKETTK